MRSEMKSWAQQHAINDSFVSSGSCNISDKSDADPEVVQLACQAVQAESIVQLGVAPSCDYVLLAAPGAQT